MKWNKIHLQNPSKLKEYRWLLHTKVINLVHKQEINDEWGQIKTAIVDAARDVTQTQGMNGGMKNARKSLKENRSKEKMITTEDKNKLEHIH